MNRIKLLNLALLFLSFFISNQQHIYACDPNEDDCDCHEAGTWKWDKELAIGKFTTSVSCSCVGCTPPPVHNQAIKVFIFSEQPEHLAYVSTGDICNAWVDEQTLGARVCTTHNFPEGVYYPYIEHRCNNQHGSSCHGCYTMDEPMIIYYQPEIELQMKKNKNNENVADVQYHFPQAPDDRRDVRLEWYGDGVQELISSDFCDPSYLDFSFDDGKTSGVCSYTLSELVVPPLGAIGIRAVATSCQGKTAEWKVPLALLSPAETDAPGYPIFDDDGDSCGPEVGAPVRLTNGNVRYRDHERLPQEWGFVGKRTYDSLNQGATGIFGSGWFSLFDARIRNVGDLIRVVKEDNTWIYFDDTFNQVWPSNGKLGTLQSFDDDGDSNPDRWVYTEPGGRIVRTYSDPLRGAGYLLSYTDTVTGQELTIDRPGYVAGVVATRDGVEQWSLDITVADGKIVTATSGMGTWSYVFSDDLLEEVWIDGALWREYSYTAAGKLQEARDGAGHIIEKHEYYAEDHPTHPGWGMTSETSGERIVNIQYDVTEDLRDLNLAAGEYAVRVTWASGLYSDYYLRPNPGSGHRVVEIRGNCSCSGGASGYDSNGRLVRRQDARGYITAWTYDSQGRVLSRGDGYTPQNCNPVHEECRVDVDTLMTINLGGDPVITTYSYDDANWPNKITSSCRDSVVQPGQSSCESHTYHPATGIVTGRTASGWTWDHATDTAVEETRTTTSLLYDGAEAAVFDPVAAASGLGVSILFDQAWVSLPQPRYSVKEVHGPLAADDVVQLVYYPLDDTVPVDLRGRLAARRDPGDLYTFFDGYDGLGNVLRTIDPAGTVRELAYDSLGRLLTSTLPAVPGCDTSEDPLCDQDLVTTYEYEETTGNVAAVVQPDGSADVTDYGATWGRVWRRQRGPTREDMQERIRYIIEPTWGNYTREAMRRYENGSWVLHKQTDFTYDARGRVDQVLYPDGATEQYEYDAAGNVVSFKDANHGSANLEYEYDPFSRLAVATRIADPDAVTSYSYDDHGNMVRVTDANGNETEYGVDDFGQTYRIVSPVTGETKMSYDAAGSPVWKQDARGVIEQRTHDGAGRLLAATYTNGGEVETVTFSYSHGRRSQAVAEDPSGAQVVERWFYQRRGQVQRYERDLPGEPTEVLHYEYGLDGGLVLRERGCERVEYVNDFAGRPVQITGTPSNCSGAPLTFASDISYLPYGPAEQIIYASGNDSDSFAYDLRYRMVSQLAVTQQGALPMQVVDRSYSYDGAGNLQTVTDNLNATRNRSYGYDDLDRLVTAAGPFGGDLSYTYDKIGNRLQKSLENAPDPPVATDYTYKTVSGHVTSLLTHVGPTEVVSDAVGNHLDDDHDSEYSYSPRNDMVLQTGHAGETLSYRYSPDGFRVVSEYQGPAGVYRASYLLQSGGNPAFQRYRDLNAGGSIVAERSYVFLGNRLLSVFDESGVTRRVVSDHITFPLMVLDDGGNNVWEAEAAPFGEVLNVVQGSDADDPLLRFPGQWQLDSRFETTSTLFYNGHRWCNPGWGGYTQSDPIGLRGGINLFDYANQNPQRYTDALGLKPDPPTPAPAPAPAPAPEPCPENPECDQEWDQKYLGSWCHCKQHCNSKSNKTHITCIPRDSISTDYNNRCCRLENMKNESYDKPCPRTGYSSEPPPESTAEPLTEEEKYLICISCIRDLRILVKSKGIGTATAGAITAQAIICISRCKGFENDLQVIYELDPSAFEIGEL